MAQKTRVDSVQGQIETAEMLSRPIVSPIKLMKIEREHFERITNSKSRRFWESEHFVQVAATTAQLMTLNNEYMEQLIQEGAVVENHFGNKVANPIHSIIRQTQSMIATNLRIMGLSANMIDGDDHKRLEDSAIKSEEKLRNNIKSNSKISLLG